MSGYIALLRGINVGGHNIIAMPALREAFERQGFTFVRTYINSGNILFQSPLDENSVKTICEMLIAKDFGLDIPVCVIAADELISAMGHAPAWWNQNPDAKHDVLFVIPPMTAQEICAQVGAVKAQYEQADTWGRLIFWSAPIATFSRTRFSKIVKDKAMYSAVTVRNANTALRLAQMAGEMG